jgi:hypothetical protein
MNENLIYKLNLIFLYFYHIRVLIPSELSTFCSSVNKFACFCELLLGNICKMCCYSPFPLVRTST